MLVNLKNGDTTMTLSKLGAEPQSVIFEGREYIWNGDKEFWPRRAPLLFPTIGPTKDNKIKAKGSYYDMPGNGFARDVEFELVESSMSSATFKLEDNEEFRTKYYPYGFKLTVTYTLLPNGYEASAEIYAKEDLPYTFGWHPAFSLDINGKGTALDSYTVSFEAEERLGKKTAVNGVFEYTKDFLVGDSIDLSREVLDKGAIVLDGIKSTEVTLTSSLGEHGVTATIGDMKTLTIWTKEKKHAQYCCIEPMLSFGDTKRCEDINEMKESSHLKAGESVTYTNTFTFF